MNSFVLPPQVWVEKTNAIGIISKSGRYGGGTYAHHDIAFEFASWVSVEFKLYLITDSLHDIAGRMRGRATRPRRSGRHIPRSPRSGCPSRGAAGLVSTIIRRVNVTCEIDPSEDAASAANALIGIIKQYKLVAPSLFVAGRCGSECGKICGKNP